MDIFLPATSRQLSARAAKPPVRWPPAERRWAVRACSEACFTPSEHSFSRGTRPAVAAFVSECGTPTPEAASG